MLCVLLQSGQPPGTQAVAGSQRSWAEPQPLLMWVHSFALYRNSAQTVPSFVPDIGVPVILCRSDQPWKEGQSTDALSNRVGLTGI